MLILYKVFADSKGAFFKKHLWCGFGSEAPDSVCFPKQSLFLPPSDEGGGIFVRK